MTTLTELRAEHKEPLQCGDCGDTYDREHRELAHDSRGRVAVTPTIESTASWLTIAAVAFAVIGRGNTAILATRASGLASRRRKA